VYEIGSRLGAEGLLVVGSDGCGRPEQLITNHIVSFVLRQSLNDIDHTESKSLCAKHKVILVHVSSFDNIFLKPLNPESAAFIHPKFAIPNAKSFLLPSYPVILESERF